MTSFLEVPCPTPACGQAFDAEAPVMECRTGHRWPVQEVALAGSQALERRNPPPTLTAVPPADLRISVSAGRKRPAPPLRVSGGRIGADSPNDLPGNRSARTSPLTEAETTLLFRTAREIAAQAPTTTPWIVPRYLAEGAITELDGKLKASGKTTLLMAMVAKILDGEEFLGRKTKKSGVFTLSEQNDTSLMAALTRAKLLERDDVVVLSWAHVRHLSGSVIVLLAKAKAEELGFLVLIVDTLPQFVGISGEAENDSGAALEAMRPLQEAAAEGLAVLITRHERKGGGEVGESGRGSSAYSGVADIVLSLRRAEGRSRETVRVLHALSRFDETPPVLVIDLVDGEYRALGTAQNVKSREARQRLLDELPTTEADAIEIEAIVEALAEDEIGRTSIQSSLRRQIGEGTVQRVGEGKKASSYRFWRLPDSSAWPDVDDKAPCDVE